MFYLWWAVNDRIRCLRRLAAGVKGGARAVQRGGATLTAARTGA